jgi:hypothetical protein
MIQQRHGRADHSYLRMQSVPRASAERGGHGASKAESGSGTSRRETSEASRWVAGGARGTWWRRAVVPSHWDEPDDHRARPTGVGRRGSGARRSGAPTRRWPEAARKKKPDLIERMDRVMEGTTAGDPTSTVKWTRKSTRALSRFLRVSHTKAWKMLRKAKYRLRFNRKRLTRRSSPDRNRQFENINRLKDSFAQQGQPVISVDAKKRELDCSRIRVASGARHRSTLICMTFRAMPTV